MKRAFTLIELLIAIVIIALISGALVYGFRKPLDQARITDAVEQFRQVDATARQQARATNRPTAVVFDLTGQTVARREGRSPDPAYRTAIPAPLRIDQVRTAAKRYDFGEIAIPCSPAGASETYAVKLVTTDSPAGEVDSPFPRWLVVAGLTGQVTQVRDEQDVTNILSHASPIGATER